MQGKQGITDGLCVGIMFRPTVWRPGTLLDITCVALVHIQLRICWQSYNVSLLVLRLVDTNIEALCLIEIRKYIKILSFL